MSEGKNTKLIARFIARVAVDANGCHIWQGSFASSGYAQMSVAGKNRSGHRLAYELFVGPIPDGLYVCHSCDVKACVNPEHFYLGDASANTKDAFDRRLIVHRESRKAECKSGHTLPAPGNDGRRQCQECQRSYSATDRAKELNAARNRAYRARRKETA